MHGLLAAVNWEDIILVGSAIGVFGGGKMLYTSLMKPKTTNGTNGKFNVELCNERHKNIEARHAEMKADMGELKSDMHEGFKAVFAKLDSIQDRLNE